MRKFVSINIFIRTWIFLFARGNSKYKYLILSFELFIITLDDKFVKITYVKNIRKRLESLSHVHNRAILLLS